MADAEYSQIGVPTRTEIDAAHRKIVQLERELRRMRDALHERSESSDSPQAGASAPKPKVAKKAEPAMAKPAAPRKGARA